MLSNVDNIFKLLYQRGDKDTIIKLKPSPQKQEILPFFLKKRFAFFTDTITCIINRYTFYPNNRNILFLS